MKNSRKLSGEALLPWEIPFVTKGKGYNERFSLPPPSCLNGKWKNIDQSDLSKIDRMFDKLKISMQIISSSSDQPCRKLTAINQQCMKITWCSNLHEWKLEKLRAILRRKEHACWTLNNARISVILGKFSFRAFKILSRQITEHNLLRSF